MSTEEQQAEAKPWPFPTSPEVSAPSVTLNGDLEASGGPGAFEGDLKWAVAEAATLSFFKPEYTTVRVQFNQEQFAQMREHMATKREDFAEGEYADFSFHLDDEVTRLNFDELKLALRYFREKKAVAINS